MCEFVSFLENPATGRLYYLKNADLETPEGIRLREYLGKKFQEDISGHGAVVQYWKYKGVGISKFRQFEITYFSSPKNFPAEIAEAVRNGELSLIGVPGNPGQLLNKTGMKLLNDDAELDKAHAEYDKAIAKLDKAHAEYVKSRAEYVKAIAKLDKAHAEYVKSRAELDKAHAEYDKAIAELDKAHAEYDKAGQTIFWEIFSDTKNRKRVWK